MNERNNEYMWISYVIWIGIIFDGSKPTICAACDCGFGGADCGTKAGGGFWKI